MTYGFLRHAVARLATVACGAPKRVLALAVLIALVATAYAVLRFDMTADSDALTSPEVPWRLSERRMADAFPRNADAILVVVDGATPERTESAAAALTAALASDNVHFQRISRLDGDDFFARHALLFGSIADVSAITAKMIEAQPMIGPLAADPSLRGIVATIDTLAGNAAEAPAAARIGWPMHDLAQAIDHGLTRPPAFFSWQELFSPASGTLHAPRRQLILIRPVLHYEDLEPGRFAADAVRAAARRLALDGASGVSVRLTGSVAQADEEFGSVIDRAWLIALAMIAAMLVTLWCALRSARIVGAIMLTTIAGLAITTALGLLAVGQLNLISVAFIPLFVGIGVDFGIQIGVRFQAERQEGADTPDALRTTAGALGPALLLAAAAICLGFLAFLPTAYVGIAELGIVAAIGMIVALLLNVTMLPALLVLMRPAARPATMIAPSLVRLDAFVLRRRKPLLALFGFCFAASIALLPLVRFDFDPLHLPSQTGEAMATLADLMRDPDRNPNTIDILAPNLAAARRIATRFGRMTEVGRVMTLDSFVPGQQAAKLAIIGDARALLDLTLDPIMIAPPASDAETVDALRRAAATLRSRSSPDARHLADSFTALAAASPEARARIATMLVAPLRVALDQARTSLTAAPVTSASLPAAIREDWIAPDGRALVELLPRGDATDNDALARFTAAVRAVAPDATGMAVSTQGAAATVAQAFVQAGAIALVAVSLLLLMVLRSLREAALTLAPVVLSGFLTLATCVLIGQKINFANIIAFPLLFGIGVAFHIYFVMAWRDGQTHLLQSSLARAIFYSALATGTAFGSLWLSRHPGTASMGKILMISLAWTLVCALIFEPALLGPPRSDRKP